MGHVKTHLLVALGLGFVVACGGAAADVAPTSGVAGDVTTTVADASAPPATDPLDERPVAPDFTLTLQPEGEFTLSDAGKPVYLVFWAEW